MASSNNPSNKTQNDNLNGSRVDSAIMEALWHAIFDVLDKDGVRSILLYAGLPEYVEGIPKDAVITQESLLKLLHAIRDLLQMSPKILKEMGRKFTFYLDPMGTALGDFIKQLNEKVGVPEFFFEIISTHELIIGLKSPRENIYAPIILDKWMVHFYEGILTQAILKSIGGMITINLIDSPDGEAFCRFKVKSRNPIKV